MAKRFSKQRKQEVHFRKSLFRFSLLFVIILSLGLGTRYYLQRISIDEKIRSALNISDQFQVIMQNPRVTFSQGLMPILGVNVPRIEIHEKSCTTKRVILQDTTFVVNPWKLLAGYVKLGWIKIGHIDLDIPSVCPRVPSLEAPHQSVDSKVASKKILTFKEITKESIKESKVTNLFKRIESILKANKISYVFVDSFSLRFLKSLESYILVKGSLSASVHDKLKTDINIVESSIDETLLPINSSHVHIEMNKSNIMMEIKSLVREGRVVAKAVIENSLNFPTKIDLKIDKLPVSVMTHFFSKEIVLNYLWFNCQIKSDSHWSELLKTDLNIPSCGFDGPYGDIELSHIQSSFSEIKSIEAVIKKIDLDKIIKSKRDLFLSGVFAHYGFLSSKFIFKERHLEVNGLIENSGFIFSRNNFRDVQKVLRIPFKFKGHSKDWQAEIKGVELEGGVVNGDIQLQMSPQSSFAQGKISLHELVLDSKIYKLMLNSTRAELKIYGKFSVAKDKISKWSALIATSLLESEFYQLKNLKLNASGGDQLSSEFKVSIEKGVLNKDIFLSNLLKPTTLDPLWNEEKKEFKEFTGKLYLSRNQEIEWKRIYLKFANGGQFSSEGTRDANKKVEAWVQWDRIDKSVLRWNFIGTEEKGQWLPESTFVKNWLNNNLDYLKRYKSINYEVTDRKSLGNKINEVGKEAMNKVKRVLVPDKENKNQLRK